MNELPAPSILDAQLAAMLQRVNQYRERSASEIRTRTTKEREEIVRGARAEARGNLHEAVERERARFAQGLRQAEARAELESRRRAQLETRTLLRHMWEGIAAVLESRWGAEDGRRAWISAALDEAAALLEGRAWHIEHAAGVSPEDRARGTEHARARGARDVQWRLERQLRAGLRIRAPGACLDATIEGLLAQRADVEATFLSEYEAAAGPLGEEPVAASATRPAPPAPEDPRP